jgi:polyisoprenoid-binding protein YceI
MDPARTAIDPPGLKRLLEGANPPVLVDVRLEEDWKIARLPGARNNCVFEVVFPTRMPAVAPDLAAPVVVYGADSGSFESRMAAEKLLRLGYSHILDFRDGLFGWKACGFPVESSTDETPQPLAVADGPHVVDLSESRIHWIGRNLLNRHEGHLALKSGSVKTLAGRLTGGHFVIDMRSITCLDLAGNSLHDVLIRHLLDHDFFDAERFPEATFTIKSAEEIANATPGSPNLSISGMLSLKDVSGPLEFTACSGVTADGKLAAQATLAFDRTRWKVLYGSGKWFRNPGGHLVNDLIELQLRIVTE